MASLKGPRLQRRLVLDIGSSAVRVCELTKTKTGFQLTKYLQRELDLPPSTPEPDRAARVSEVLNDLLKEAKIRARKTVFGVPGQSVFTRTRALPPVPEHKVPQIVRYEIQQQIPFSLDQIALGYQVLARTEAGGYDVLMAAIKVDVVDKRLDIIKTAKRSVGIVDVCPIAAYNWLKTTGEFGAHGECVALIDLGASTTDIVIEREGQFRFTRSLNLGGNDITNAIGNTFSMSFEEAERLKRQRGFAPTGDTQRDGKGGEVIGQLLNRLVTEINRSFAYFRSQPGGGPVSRVVITGGGACLRNIVPYLQRQLNMEVRIAQPLAGLAIAPAAQAVNEHPEQAAVALGLALRNCGDVPISINLIPPRIIEGARRKQQYFYWAASLLTVLAIFATIIPDMQNKIVEVERHTNMARDVIGKYDPRLVDNPASACQYDDDLNIAKNYIKGIQDNIASIDTFYNRRRPWLQYLNALNDARQRDPVWFTRVFSTTLSVDDPTMAGRASGAFDDDDEDRARRPGLASAIQRRPMAGLAATGEETDVARILDSSGFPGITADQARGGFRGGGRLGSGRYSRDDDEEEDSGVSASVFVPQSAGTTGTAGAFGQMGRPGAIGPAGTVAPEDLDPMPLPNGLEIHGYAADEGVVLNYVERLKARDEFIEVYLDGRSVNPVPNTDLGQSFTVGLPAAVAGSPTVVTFVILVQVDGEPLKATEVGSTGFMSGAGSAGDFGGRRTGLRGGTSDGGRVRRTTPAPRSTGGQGARRRDD